MFYFTLPTLCEASHNVGKTTTAVNLGIGLAMQGKKVLLVDADALFRIRNNASNAEILLIPNMGY